MKQTRGLFCMCESSVASLKHNCHFWQMNLMFQAYILQGQVRLAGVNHIYVFHEVFNGCKKKKSKDSLKACFQNLNIMKLHQIRSSYYSGNNP